MVTKPRFTVTRGTDAASLRAVRDAAGERAHECVGPVGTTTTLSGLLTEVARLRRRRRATLAALERYRALLAEQLSEMEEMRGTVRPDVEDLLDDEALEGYEAQLDLFDKVITVVRRELGVVGVTARPEDEDEDGAPRSVAPQPGRDADAAAAR